MKENRMAMESIIATVDGKPFLSARMGIIDICPDQQFLLQELQPIYIPVQTGEISAPELKPVSREAAEGEPCPKPDWNYLSWDGYSNERYKAIIDGKSLLDWQWYGETYKMELRVCSYVNEGNMAIERINWTKGEPEPWDVLTVNLAGRLEKDCAFIDIDNIGNNILLWLERNGLAEPTGRMRQSGYVVYPEYRFNAQRLQEFDPKGYAEYSTQYDHQKRRKSKGQER